VYGGLLRGILLFHFLQATFHLSISFQLCPEPEDGDEKKLQNEEDKLYIRGRIS